MSHKTKLDAEDGRHDLTISRDFELPLELLFKAYIDPEIVEQWMSTNVIKLDNKRHGGWQFETRDAEGRPVFKAHGVIHDIIENTRIVRTFEMENAPFGPQLEFLEFERTGEGSSRLKMQIVYRSGEIRDQMLKLPFAQGLNMAHNRLQEIAGRLK